MAFLLSFLLYSFLSYRQVHGWKLDASCTQMGVADDIRNAMTGAFEMVNSARVRLSASPWAADTTELIGHLFAKDGQNPAELDMFKTRSIFDSIDHNYKTEVIADQESDRRNIVVFCTLDRFKKVEGRFNLYRDQTDGILYKYNEQSCRGSLSNFVALAVTTNPFITKPPRAVMETRKPTQLQLCPWFVDWMKNKEFKLHRDVARTNIGRHFLKAPESEKYGLRQIDVFSLLDKTLLHEMMHGRMAWTEFRQVKKMFKKEQKETFEGLDDVTDPSFWGLGLPAYGWKRAISLAKKGQDFRQPKAPDNNAETLALFASACLLLDDANNRRKVDVEGRVVPRT